MIQEFQVKYNPDGTVSPIKPPLDKPAALMALIDYCELTGNGRADSAIEKLAAQIIAEVEAENE
jgi:hypothetical protein